jgi:IclR family acetate operon transcriptional repressor
MTSRVTDDRLPAIGRIVREVAADLTLALGGVLPEAKSA